MDHGERLARLESEMKSQTRILTEICRDTKHILKANAEHELSDERRFGYIESRVGKVETNLKLTKAIGTPLLALLHGLHFWK